MTAPEAPAPVQNPAQAPVQQVPVPAAAPEPAPGADPNAPWPPDEETLLQLQMDARFSIIEEPGDENTPETADRQAVPSPGAPAPAQQQQAPQQPPVKE